jgi:lysyl-tRNA synthetase class 2
MFREQNNWQPTASIETLQLRAQLIKQLRAFFEDREILEVDVPIMAPCTVTDPFVHSITAHYANQTYYLQTSPEYFMKRLLAAGSGDIYTLTKSFRHDEPSKIHNSEFTLLEWYRVGFNLPQLMQDVATLIQTILPGNTVQYFSYQTIFIDCLQLDPLSATLDELKQAGKNLNYTTISDDKDSWLQVLFTEYIEPTLINPTFIYHFPASQAALAKLNADDERLAERFELYIKGVELANGFHELQNAALQLQRFEHNNQLRQLHKLPELEIDTQLLAALEHGLPDCAGVALGVDRLIMLALGSNTIAECTSFIR